jgi:ABC-type Fe3+-hydroxamate transport system substrate-binding protein
VSPRVVSLVPSATETLLAWKVEPVAVTRFCEQGERFPTVGGTKNPDIDAIGALRPDLVVMCDQENRRPDAEALAAMGLTVHAISILSVADVGPQMVALAEAVGVPSANGERCRVDPDGVPRTRTRAYVPIWRRPWMTITAETYGGSLLACIGYDSVASGGDRYPVMDLDEARRRGAEVVLAPDEPYAFTERHRAELETVAPVRFVDGQDLFWWGARSPAARQRLAAALAR